MNYRRPNAACLAVGALLALAACQQQKAPDAKPEAAAASPDAKPGLAVHDGVLVLPAVTGRPGAAYFTVVNGSDKPVSIAAVSVEGAGKAEMHETNGGSMAPIKALPLRPGETATFARGGKHVMLFDLAGGVKPGAEAEITLTFEGGDKVSAPLKVESAAGAMAGMDHGGDH